MTHKFEKKQRVDASLAHKLCVVLKKYDCDCNFDDHSV